MSCATCVSECGRHDGCGTRKAEQKIVLDELIARLYPGKMWGEPDVETCFRAGPERREVQQIQKELSVALKAPSYFRDGEDEDLCSAAWVLCLGREPPLLDVREQGLSLLLQAGETPAGLALRERYLRIAFSRVGRLASVQEVALELDVEADLATLREIQMPGVFDPKLLKRFQKAVDLLQAHDIQHLDMGLLDLPAAQFGLRPGDYADRYGTDPGLFNFLFFAQPLSVRGTTYLPVSS